MSGERCAVSGARRQWGALLCFALSACAGKPDDVVTLPLPTWYEDGGSSFDIAPGGQWATFTGRTGNWRVDLRSGRADSGTTAFGKRPPSVPAAALFRESPDGSRIGFFVPGEDTLWAGPADRPRLYPLDGAITGLGWTPKGDVLYALVRHTDGLSSLDRINVETQALQPIREGLDAPPRLNSIAVSADGRTLYLALASDTVPRLEERHRPGPQRDTDIYALDLHSGRLAVVARGHGDDLHPATVGDTLYWTHNQFADQIVIVPASGGPARPVIEDAMLPYWSADGKQLAYTAADYRLADWGLNLDAFVVGVDDSGRANTPARPIAAGYHEDFTPAWSPNGAWIAYHSHRSPLPTPTYDSPGHTDDIYLRRPDAPMKQEIRLTDWGWEVGVADWAPDGRQLVFDSWDPGVPGIAKPWIVTVDTVSSRLVDKRRLPLPAGMRGTRFLSWSPTGDAIALVAQEAPGRQALWLTSPDGRNPRRLVEYQCWTYGGLDWTPDGRAIVYGAQVGGRVQLFRIERSGGSPVQLTRDSASVMHPQVSPDGRWIATTRMVHRKVLRRLKP